jgi:hypothetical protein
MRNAPICAAAAVSMVERHRNPCIGTLAVVLATMLGACSHPTPPPNCRRSRLVASIHLLFVYFSRLWGRGGPHRRPAAHLGSTRQVGWTASRKSPAASRLVPVISTKYQRLSTFSRPLG